MAVRLAAFDFFEWWLKNNFCSCSVRLKHGFIVDNLHLMAYFILTCARRYSSPHQGSMGSCTGVYMQLTCKHPLGCPCFLKMWMNLYNRLFLSSFPPSSPASLNPVTCTRHICSSSASPGFLGWEFIKENKEVRTQENKNSTKKAIKKTRKQEKNNSTKKATKK